MQKFFNIANFIPPASHVFNSVSWRPPVPLLNKPYYQGTYPGQMPAGSHNQFVPLQVRKEAQMQTIEESILFYQTSG